MMIHSSLDDRLLLTRRESIESRNYWQSKLSNIFIEERVKLFEFSNNHETSYHQLLPDVSAKVIDLCKGNDIAIYIFMVSVLAILKGKYTGTTDTLTGMPSFHREDQPRHVDQLLPLRNKVDPNTTFKDLLLAVKATVFDGKKHQHYKLKSLENEIQYSSLAECIDVLAYARSIHDYDPVKSTGVPLAIGIHQQNGLISFDVVWRGKASFPITQFMHHFYRIINHVSSHINCKIADIDLLNDKELAAIMKLGAGEKRSGSPNSVVDWLEEQAKRNLGNVAIEYNGLTLTYQQLHNWSDAIASYILHNCKVNRGDKVVLLSTRDEKIIPCIIGILKAGAVYVPIDEGASASRIQHILNDVAPALIISDNAAQLSLSRPAPVLSLKNDWEKILFSKHHAHHVEIHPEDLAYIIYTSGSTGNPKGTMVTHSNLIHFLGNIHAAYRWDAGSRMPFLASPAFDISLFQIFAPLTANGSVLVFDKETILDTEQFVDQLKYVTVLDTVPALYKQIADAIRERGMADAYDHIRTLFIGGDAIPDDLLNELTNTFRNADIVVTYGPTETTVFCTSIKYEADELKRRKIKGNIIGTPLYNNQVYIFNKENQLLPVGVEGEICIAGPAVSRGYLNQEKLTNEKFLSDPYHPENKLYRTGDMGCLLSDGTVEFRGRKDNQVKIRGHRIELSEIENKLSTFEGIKDVALVADEDHNGKTLIAFYTGKRVEAHVWRTYLEEHLPNYMIPSSLIWMECIPLTSNGKVDRRSLLQAARQAHQNGRVYVAPATLLEKKIAALWEEVLGKSRIGVTDNFFESGGHSLLAAKMSARLYDATQVKVPLSVIFKGPTVKEIIAFIEKADRSYSHAIEPVKESEYYDVSHAQKRLWVLDQLEERQTAYNISSVFFLDGAIDLNLLQQSFDRLIDRHEILRTTFVLVEGNLKQKIHPVGALDFRIEYKDLRPVCNESDFLKERASREMDSPFSLDKSEPLLRFKIYKTGGSRYFMLFTIHHIIADGWSMQVLISEVLEVYNGLYRGRDTVLPPLKIQYKDYSAWQHKLLSTDALNAPRQYWLSQFAGEIPVLQLPADKQRPATKTYTGDSVSLSLDKEVTARLYQAAAAHQVTLFMLLITAVKALFYRYTGQDHIVIGYPVAGRDHDGMENQIGCYVNTLALSTKFDKDDTLHSLLLRVKETLQQAYDHQSYPFDKLVDELSMSRDLSRSPLFDVMLSLQNVASSFPAAPIVEGAIISPYQHHAVTSMFDLSIDFVPDGDVLKIDVIYNTDLFYENRMHRMLKHLNAMIENIITNINQPIATIDYVSEEEKLQIVSNCSTNTIAFSDATLVDLIEEQAHAHPANIAVICKNKSVTYAQLNKKANHIASLLKMKYFVQKGDFVGMVVPRSAEVIELILGIFKAGAVYLPIDTEYPDERIHYIIKDAAPKVVFVEDSAWRDKLALTTETCVSLEEVNNFRSVFDETEIAKPTGGDLAYILYTSGSTGKPKGVLIEHGSIARYAMGFKYYFNITESDSIVQQSSLSFDTSLEEIFPILIAAGKLVIIPEGGRDIEKLVETIIAEKVTLLSTTPLVLNELNQQADVITGSHLRCLIVGGDELKVSHIDKLFGRIPIHNGYGPTESTICATFCEVTDLGEITLIGMPFYDRSVYILDDDLQIVPEGVVGEICIGGGGVARGYLNREELTREKFINNPYGEGKLYRSGDIGRWKLNGTVEFLGRKDDQVKIRGYRVELGEVENVIRKFGELETVIVAAHNDPQHGKIMVAYYQCSRDIEDKELRSFALENLPSYMVPSFFQKLSEIPLNANGKVDKKKLPKPESGDSSYLRSYIKPQNSLQEKLVNIWEEELSFSPIGIENNFFEIGGHSIKAMRILSKIYQRFHVTLTLRDIFLSPTIKDISKKIADLVGSSTEPIEKASEQSYYDLSHSQKLLWIHAQIEKDLPIYNMSDAYLFEGQLNFKAFEQAFNALIERHESLRTVFVTVSGEPKQKILRGEDFQFKVAYIDLKNVADKEKAAGRLAKKELDTPFNLEAGPLLRARLIELEEDRHVFIFTIHHLVSDEWSMVLLGQEIIKLYMAFSQGFDNPLPPLSYQFRDFVVKQNHELQGERLKAHKEYWLDQLRGELPVLELPYDRPRPAIKTYHGSSVALKFDERTEAGIKGLCQRCESTLFTGLITCVNLLLHKYTAQQDVIVGYPVSGRDYAGLENQIGLYVNTLALRTQLPSTDPFEEILLQVKNKVLNAFEHQLYPFDSLLGELNIKRDLSRSPLFDVMVVYQNIPETITSRSNNLNEIIIKDFNTEYSIARYDLSFYFTESPEGIHLSINYNSDLFDEQTVRCLLKHYHNLVDSVVQNPSGSIDRLNYMDEAERKNVIQNFNNTSTVYPRNAVVHQLFEEQVKRTPGALAVISDKRSLTYDQLNKEANKLAHYLREMYAIAADGFVGILLERSELVIVAVLATLKAGGAYVPVDPRYPKERKREVFNDAKPKVLITQSEFLLDCNEYYQGNLYVIDIQLEELPKHDENIPNINNAEDLAYVMYTSGSTGTPKGVMIHHRSIARLVCNTNFFTPQPSYKLLLTGALSFDATTFEIWGMLLHGGELYVVPENTLINIFDFGSVLRNNRITHLWLTSSWFNQIVDADSSVFDNLKYLIVGGDKLSPHHIKKIKKQFPALALINGYGPTENTTFSTFYVIEQDEFEGPVPIGKPISNSTAYVLDEYLQPVAVGVKGEIYLGGDGVARGYLNASQLTEEKFLDDPFHEGAKLYRTGDIGKWRADGNLMLLGRADGQIKIRGFRVELGDIQNVLTAHTCVRQALATVKEDSSKGDKYIVAYYTATQSLPPEPLRQHMLQFVPDYMVPSYFIQLETFPLSINGKVDTALLPEPGDAYLAIRARFEAPQTDTEKRLALIWEEVLGHSPVGVHDDFFVLGGHSLKAMQIISRIASTFSARVDLNDIFSKTTIRSLAAVVGASLGMQEEAIPIALPGEYYELSMGQKRLWAIEQLKKSQSAYHIANAYYMDGTLNVKALQNAFDQLIHRHESLRTVFITVGAEPKQKILSSTEANVKLEYQDWKNDERAENRALQYFKHESRSPFDLEKGPLLRVSLVRIAQDRYIFFFAIHHIVVDGWSLQILLRDLSVLYNAQEQLETATLTPLRIQYKDYATWQHNFINSDRSDNHKMYWSKKLSGDIAALSLPSDFPDTTGQSSAISESRSISIQLTFGPDLTKNLKHFSNERETTIFTCLVAALKIVLQYYCKQKDIVLGSPSAGRKRRTLEDQAGFYLNMLVLRDQVETTDTFEEFFAKTKSTILDAIKFEDYPFELVAQNIKTPDGSLLEAIVDFHRFDMNFDHSIKGFRRLGFTPVPQNFSGKDYGKFNVSFLFQELENDISLLIEYNVNKFMEGTVQNWGGALSAVLGKVINQPAIVIEELNSFLREWEERQKIKKKQSRKQLKMDGLLQSRT